MRIRKILLIAAAALCTLTAGAQRQVRLDILRTMELATDSSLSSDRYRSVYDQAKWNYEAYLATRKPQISLVSTPLEYDHYMVQRYLSDEDRDVYRQQRKLYSSASVQATQDIEALGGTLYGNAGVSFLRSFGAYNESQFSTVPILVGYKQELLGFNSLKWNKLLEPLKMQAAEKQFAYEQEEAATVAAEKFFDLALAQENHNIAKDYLASCDTLYAIGKRKFYIASISKAELLILDIDRTNAQNNLINTQISLRQAMQDLALWLKMDENTQIELIIPKAMMNLRIDPVEAVNKAQENNPTYITDRQAIVSAHKDLAKAKVERRWNASVDVKAGLNQVDNNLWYAIGHPLLQDYASISLTIPLLDWGAGKYKQLAAESALENTLTTARQNSETLELKVRQYVSDFNQRQTLVENTMKTQATAEEAYNATLQRFASGKASVSDITIAQNRWQMARQNYVNALKNYWLAYYELRKVTLYDFIAHKTITHR